MLAVEHGERTLPPADTLQAELAQRRERLGLNLARVALDQQRLERDGVERRAGLRGARLHLLGTLLPRDRLRLQLLDHRHLGHLDADLVRLVQQRRHQPQPRPPRALGRRRGRAEGVLQVGQLRALGAEVGVYRVGRRLAHTHARPVVPPLARVAPHHETVERGRIVARAVGARQACAARVAFLVEGGELGRRARGEALEQRGGAAALEEGRPRLLEPAVHRRDLVRDG